MLMRKKAVMADAIKQYQVNRWCAGTTAVSDDWVAEEVPVALVYNGISHVVMMCSPQHLEDFARGFTLSECIVEHLHEIYDIQVSELDEGIQVELEIAQSRFWALKEQRRALAGRTGCGICGKESLQQMACTLPPLDNRQRISSEALQQALSHINSQQHLFNKTGSVHAAAWCDPDGTIAALREDVGRHNALDKLIGHCLDCAHELREGMLIMTSRASYEIVQKAAASGISVVAAVSGPTGMAIRLAEEMGITLIGFARNASLCVYSHPERII
ncbi:MAG: formate dehydrogenase accessory sulfurtransferase FdhD [Sedimenticola sp.]|nr:formate dehydrogenase accessory sulfurtransferase FdhD [Sedimenticola sp.]MCW8920780.1 formate dehydrogenase accessory sulfurtransferase FdhD [Sedimenticola sp.]MCW8947569.1 formate dehydrogenase accessory sulfurtransferase FdhD [Sedimenticola sp.]MCW8949704.1 formate dehydrogenase accessory sulfurtransferase FdhD [Sedimenticola sp.]MCW8976018.1 formate dehydrogenase accessory sulfurtransferase FdhD [Sedimenticola sp.]